MFRIFVIFFLLLYFSGFVRAESGLVITLDALTELQFSFCSVEKRGRPQPRCYPAEIIAPNSTYFSMSPNSRYDGDFTLFLKRKEGTHFAPCMTALGKALRLTSALPGVTYFITISAHKDKLQCSPAEYASHSVTSGRLQVESAPHWGWALGSEGTMAVAHDANLLIRSRDVDDQDIGRDMMLGLGSDIGTLLATARVRLHYGIELARQGSMSPNPRHVREILESCIEDFQLERDDRIRATVALADFELNQGRIGRCLELLHRITGFTTPEEEMNHARTIYSAALLIRSREATPTPFYWQVYTWMQSWWQALRGGIGIGKEL